MLSRAAVVSLSFTVCFSFSSSNAVYLSWVPWGGQRGSENSVLLPPDHHFCLWGCHSRTYPPLSYCCQLTWGWGGMRAQAEIHIHLHHNVLMSPFGINVDVYLHFDCSVQSLQFSLGCFFPFNPLVIGISSSKLIKGMAYIYCPSPLFVLSAGEVDCMDGYCLCHDLLYLTPPTKVKDSPISCVSLTHFTSGCVRKVQVYLLAVRGV